MEAFLAYRAGDLARTNDSYERALELGSQQPQLHFWYGGFLMRATGDYERAAAQFDLTLQIDASSPSVVYREAARNRFFMYDFDLAESLLEKAWANERKTFKDEIILTDLQVQLYCRRADHLFGTGDPVGAAANLRKLFAFIQAVDGRKIDATLVEHLMKARRTIEGVLE